MPKIHVGISGWSFEGWRGGFYPKGLTQKKELEYAASQVNSIEINGTFYSMQKPESFQKWHEQTPDDFCFTVKAPKFITHIRRLKDVEEPLCNFLSSGLFCLGAKMGPILWQFPPTVSLKDNRFEKFFELLPRDSKSACRMAKKHTSFMKGRTHLKVAGDYPVRHAFEFRHPSFVTPEFIDLMRKHGVAFVLAHAGLKSPYTEDLTADFVYARMHGEDKEFKKGYTDETLDWWSRRVQTWSGGYQPDDAQCVSKAKIKRGKRDAFIYFDTENKARAPFDALALMKRLGL